MELSQSLREYVTQWRQKPDTEFMPEVDGTLLEKTKLKIEIIPGNALCHNCQQVFHLLEAGKQCPHCQSRDWEIVSGKEFNIKEIVAC